MQVYSAFNLLLYKTFDITVSGNLDRIKQIISQRGVEYASVADDKGYYAMHWAALGGHIEVMRYLVSIDIPLSLATKNEVYIIYIIKF